MKKPDSRSSGAGLGYTTRKPAQSCPVSFDSDGPTAVAVAELQALHRMAVATGWPAGAYLAIAAAIKRHRPDDPVSARRWRRLALFTAAAIEEVVG